MKIKLKRNERAYTRSVEWITVHHFAHTRHGRVAVTWVVLLAGEHVNIRSVELSNIRNLQTATTLPFFFYMTEDDDQDYQQHLRSCLRRSEPTRQRPLASGSHRLGEEQ